MIKILNIENTEIKDILTRDINLETGVEDIVSGVIENVKLNGDKALFEYCEKFDGAKLSCLEVSKEEIDAAYEKEDKEFLATTSYRCASIIFFRVNRRWF